MTLKLLIPTMALGLISCQHSQVAPESTVVVKDVRIPKGMPWYARFASHSFIDYQSDDSGTWRRIEIVNKNSGIRHREIPETEVTNPIRWDNPVRIVSQSRLPVEATAAAIAETARAYDASLYRPWPGPNSNTFTRVLVMEVDGLHAHLEPNATGKEFTWHAGRTPGGTGLEIKTPLLGAAIGLREGVELNFLGITAGIGIWPPSLKLPILPQLPFRPTMQPQTE